MKICIVLPNSSQDSEEFYNKQEIGLAKSLLSYNVSVDIFLFSKSVREIIGEEIQKDGPNQINVYKYPGIALPGQQAFSLKLLFYLLKNLKEYSFLQVHDNTQILSILAAMVGHRVHCPVVLFQGMYKDFVGWKKKLLQFIYDLFLTRYLLGHVRLIICKTIKAKEYLKKKGLSHNVKVAVLGVGLDIDKFKHSDNDCVDDSSFLPKDIDILFVGRLDKNRNAYFMMTLFKDIVRDKPTVSIVVVGGGSEFERCKKFIERFDMGRNVIFLGKIKNKQLPAIYKESKILITPSSYEIFGMVILEAMFFGVVVVASDTAGSNAIIRNGYDGVIVKELSNPKWCDVINRLLDNDRDRNNIAVNAREKVLNNFVWDKLGKRFFELYNEILNVK